MKRKINISESDLRNMIKHSVKRILKEATKDEMNKEWNKNNIKGLYNFMKGTEGTGDDNMTLNYDYLDYIEPDDEDYGSAASYGFTDDDGYAGNISSFVPGGVVNGKEIEDRWNDPVDDDDIEIGIGSAETEDYGYGGGHTSYKWNRRGKMDDMSNDELSKFNKKFSKDVKKKTTDKMYNDYGNKNLNESVRHTIRKYISKRK